MSTVSSFIHPTFLSVRTVQLHSSVCYLYLARQRFQFDFKSCVTLSPYADLYTTISLYHDCITPACSCQPSIQCATAHKRNTRASPQPAAHTLRLHRFSQNSKQSPLSNFNSLTHRMTYILLPPSELLSHKLQLQPKSGVSQVNLPVRMEVNIVCGSNGVVQQCMVNTTIGKR